MLKNARLTSAACLLATLATPALAQVASGNPPDPTVAPGAQNQSIERIRLEDKGSRIDELRVGGQTRSISVQPKNDMPAYEVRPADAQGSPSSGKRVWTFQKF
jgi:hypothetical protein